MPDLPNRVPLLRPLDLLALEMQTTNLRLGADGAHLELVDETKPGLIAFHFPSQHVAERTFSLTADGAEPAQPSPVSTIAAGPSRLVFALPEGTTSLAMSDLFGWDALVPQLAPNARGDALQTRPRPALPADDVTAIELPWRMFLSPTSAGNRKELHLADLVGPNGENLEAYIEVTWGGPAMLFWTLCLKGDLVEYFNRFCLSVGIAAVVAALIDGLLPAAEAGGAIIAIRQFVQTLGAVLPLVRVVARGPGV